MTTRPTKELGDLHQRFGGKCFHCGGLTLLTVIRCPRQATRDHYIPRSKGGGDGKNIVLACYQCNSRKRNKILPRGARQS